MSTPAPGGAPGCPTRRGARPSRTGSPPTPTPSNGACPSCRSSCPHSSRTAPTTPPSPCWTPGPRSPTSSPSTRSGSPTRAICAPPPSGRSVLELARSIGYELRPGWQSSTCLLAFTVEDAPGTPGRAVVPAGTPVQSIPGQGELPQTFETGAELRAVAEHNAIRLRAAPPATGRQRHAPDSTWPEPPPDCAPATPC